MKENSIRLNALLNIIHTISNMLFPMITFSYVSRVLQVDVMGRVNFFSSVSSYAIMLASLGISTYGIRTVARNRDDKDKLSKITRELFTINYFATIIVIVMLVAVTPFVYKFYQDISLLIVNCILVASAPLGMNWFFSGLEQYTYITKRNIVFKALSLIAIFVFVREERDYILYASIMVCSSVGSCICNFIYAKKFLIKKTMQLELRTHFKPMFILFASILAINIYTHVDTVMLGFISGDTEVGLYTVAVYVKTALLTMVNAISAVLLPRISFFYNQNNELAIDRILKKSITIIYMIALPVTIFFIIEAKESVLLLGGSSYLGAVKCMQIIMPILIISGFSNIIGNQILIPLGKESNFMYAVITGALVNIIFNLFLMPEWGCVGAAVSTLMAELTQMSIQFWGARRRIYNKFNRLSLFKITIATLSCTFISLLTKITVRDFSALIDIVLISIIYFASYALVLFVLREKEFIDIIQLTIRKIKNRKCRDDEDTE